MPPRATNREIKKQFLIICEGRDAQEFLISYLNSEVLDSSSHFSEDIQVIDFGGNDDLTKFLELLRNMENFDNVKSLLIIRDAETNFESAIQSIQKSLESNGLSIPKSPFMWENGTPKIGFLLFPNCSAESINGTLEDLCLSILSNAKAPELKQEIVYFMDTLKEKYHFNFSRPFKTKLYAYFSIHNDYVSLKIGEAAKAGAFDWNHENLAPLKEFLAKMLS